MNNNIQETKEPKGLKALINSDTMREQFARALPKHLTADRFTRVCITALTRNPKLQECTPESFMRCLLDLSAMGLEPDGRRAHLIPYGKECTLVVDYKGTVELVMRSGIVSIIHADKVCENDAFEYDRGEIKQHKIDFKKPRGNAYAYYALVRFKDGSEKAEVMSMEDIEAIRERSQGYKSAIQYKKSHPWITDFDEMAKKTVFKRCSKWLQLSPEIRDALEKGDDDYVSDADAIRTASGRVVPSEEVPTLSGYEDVPPVDEPPVDGLEPVMESPVEVSEETERLNLINDIMETIHDFAKTPAYLIGKARNLGHIPSGVNLTNATIEQLREIHANRKAIAES